MQPLNDFKKKAIGWTISLLVLGVVMVGAGAAARADAISRAYLHNSYSSSYSYIEPDTSTADAMIYFGAGSMGAGSIALFFWVGSNLAIAYKKSNAE